MRPPLHTLKGWMATIISLWMAVLACLMGCALPALADSHAIHTSAARTIVAETVAGTSAVTSAGGPAKRGEPEPMADMECCHHSGGQAPTKPGDGKPVPGGTMSCCPLEITIAPKWEPAALSLATRSFATTQDFVLACDGDLVGIRFFHSVEVVPPVWHSGRDTLLKTRLLRI
jgi:hypothetical protein